MTRRGILGLAAGAALLPSRRQAWADGGMDAFPQSITLIVAGPPGGRLDTVSKAMLPGLQTHLPPDTIIARSAIGGLDGVTGANQFATQSAPDGASALLVPGAAPLAWLVGDSRVHFDPSRWLPVLAGVGSAIVVAAARTTPRPGVPIRVAAGGPVGPALSAMLALDLLGAAVVPTFGLDDERTALATLAAGQVDVVFLRNLANVNQLAALAPGATALFSAGVPDSEGSYSRDPAAPDIPTFLEYAAALGRPVPAGPRYDAWRCAAATAQIRYALVLQSLTPPSTVALWRDAGTHAFTAALAVTNEIVYASAAAGLTQSLNPNGAALLDVRGWLASRLGWQPS